MSEETNIQNTHIQNMQLLKEELAKLTKELVEAKRTLRENLTKYVNRQNNWSPEQFTDVYMRNIELVRAVRKKLSETRYRHNKLYLDLLKIEEKRETAAKVKRVENSDMWFMNDKIDVTGFLTMSEVKVLFNALFDFMINHRDPDTLGLNVRVDGNDFFVTPVKEDAR